MKDYSGLVLKHHPQNKHLIVDGELTIAAQTLGHIADALCAVPMPLIAGNRHTVYK